MELLGTTYLLHIKWRDKSVTHLTVETGAHESTYDLFTRLLKHTLLGGAWFSRATISVSASVPHLVPVASDRVTLQTLAPHCPLCKLTRKETNCE